MFKLSNALALVWVDKNWLHASHTMQHSSTFDDVILIRYPKMEYTFGFQRALQIKNQLGSSSLGLYSSNYGS